MPFSSNKEGVYVEPSIAKRNKCPSCGADLVFDAQSNSLYCQHCESKFAVSNEVFNDKKTFLPNELTEETIKEEKHSIKCLNCGASEEITNLTISTICPFCGSPKISTELKNRYKPDAIVPFKIDKDKISGIFKTWIKKRKFVPNKFKNVKNLEFLKPYYVSSWLFDTKSKTQYSGVLEYDRTEHYTDSQGRRQTRTVTDYKRVSGSRDDVFENITSCSSEARVRNLFPKIEPFDLSNIKVYSDEYLAGYYTDNYSVGIRPCWSDTYNFINSSIKSRIVRSHNADRYQYLNLDINFSYTKYAFAFLPVWIGHYLYEGKTYDILVNGTSGKISGKRPVSKIKVAIFVIFLLAIVFAIAYFATKCSGDVAGA